MFWQQHRRFLFSAAVIAAVFVVAALLNAWDGFQQTNWWYPETDAYQLWVLLVLGAGVYSFVRGPNRAADGVWALLLTLSLSGLWRLGRHIVEHYSPGDLLLNYRMGAFRLRNGGWIYDEKGLAQGVNASPLALLLHFPLAFVTDMQAIKINLIVQVVWLVVFMSSALAWLKKVKGEISIADAGVALCGLSTFFSFQRSCRLGQLDLTLIALLMLALALYAEGNKRRQALSAFVAALATGLKLVPGVGVLGMLFKASARWWLAWFAASLVAFVGFSVLMVGVEPCVSFVRNMANISHGTTAGNNYAMGARLATLGNRKIREFERPLQGRELWIQRGVMGVSLVLLVWFCWRRRTMRTEYLIALWLAAIPLLVPICWDVYLVWCGFLPWLLLWSELSARWQGQSKRENQLKLLSVFCGGAYLVGGTMGNTAWHDLDSGVGAQLSLPTWLDEMPIVGQLLLLGVMVFTWAKVDPERTS